ncbi:MAG: IS200/IS605 family transposase, partial [Patescibacteria group bacterium]
PGVGVFTPACGGAKMPKQYLRLRYHVIWSTKMREKLIKDDFKIPLYDFLRSKIRQMQGIPLAIGGMADHVHCLVFIPPRVAAADFIGDLKGASSYWINHEVKPGGGFAWQSGYGMITVSPGDQRDVTDYILNQECHHSQGTVRREMETIEDEE